MRVFVKGSFKRDVARVSNLPLLLALQEKLEQLEKSPDATHVTALKALRGYRTHFRIHVRASHVSYRIGAIIRGQSIWLVRFLPRRTIYQQFP